jgi:hypothetical protein
MVSHDADAPCFADQTQCNRGVGAQSSHIAKANRLICADGANVIQHCPQRKFVGMNIRNEGYPHVTNTCMLSRVVLRPKSGFSAAVRRMSSKDWPVPQPCARIAAATGQNIDRSDLLP